MMRTRSSPRCSMNDILSSTRPIPRLPALHEVAKRTHTAPGLKPFADGRGDIGFRFPDRVGQRPAARETRGDRGRERAAGAMGRRRNEVLTGEACERVAVPQDVGRAVLEMAALHEHGPWHEIEDAP